MRHRRKIPVLIAAVIIMAGMCLSSADLFKVDGQTPLTYPEVKTALQTKLPNQSFRNKTELIGFVIGQVRRRKMDKPLTKEREADLRQAGATEELIEVIRTNSPALPVQTPTPRPTPVPVIDLGDLLGRAVDLVKPEYTTEARQAGTAGEVKLALELDESGGVTSVTRLTVLPNGLTEQAVEAARRSKFRPALSDGKPARGSGILTYNFKINLINISATLATADQLRSKADCDRAITEYSRIVSVDAKNYKALFGRGLCYLVKNNYENAVSDFDSAGASSPADTDAAFYQAVAHDLVGDSKASIYYAKTASLAPDIGRQPMMECLYIERFKTTEEARSAAAQLIDACTKSLHNAREPLLSLIYVKRGIGHRLRSDYDKAIADFETARRLNPQFSSVVAHLHTSYNSRGLLRYNKKEFKLSFDDITTAINLNPQSPTPYVNRCVIQLYAWKKIDEAISDCSTAIRLSDKSSMAYNHRGYAYEIKNYRNEAIADYQKALEVDPRNEIARTNLNRLQPQSPSIKRP